MASIKQSYSPINSLQKMVDDIPSTDKTKHKKHKEDKKERMETSPPISNIDPHTSSDFAPNELLTELGFDVSQSTSSSTRSTTTMQCWMKRRMISTYVFFTTLIWNCSRPSLTWNGSSNAPFPARVDYSLTETSKMPIWEYSTERFMTFTEN